MANNLLKGKRGIIFGALNSQSIAWKVAQRAHEEGATFVLTNAPIAMRMGEINNLAEETGSQIIPADATNVEELDHLVTQSMEILGGKIDSAWSGGIHNRYPEKMKVIASMNPGPLLASPDVPSIIGKYGVSMPGQAVIVVPKGTPADVVAKLEVAVEGATKDADFRDLVLGKLKFPVTFIGSEEITSQIAETVKSLKVVIEKTK